MSVTGIRWSYSLNLVTVDSDFQTIVNGFPTPSRGLPSLTGKPLSSHIFQRLYENFYPVIRCSPFGIPIYVQFFGRLKGGGSTYLSDIELKQFHEVIEMYKLDEEPSVAHCANWSSYYQGLFAYCAYKQVKPENVTLGDSEVQRELGLCYTAAKHKGRDTAAKHWQSLSEDDKDVVASALMICCRHETSSNDMTKRVNYVSAKTLATACYVGSAYTPLPYKVAVLLAAKGMNEYAGHIKRLDSVVGMGEGDLKALYGDHFGTDPLGLATRFKKEMTQDALNSLFCEALSRSVGDSHVDNTKTAAAQILATQCPIQVDEAKVRDRYYKAIERKIKAVIAQPLTQEAKDKAIMQIVENEVPIQIRKEVNEHIAEHCNELLDHIDQLSSDHQDELKRGVIEKKRDNHMERLAEQQTEILLGEQVLNESEKKVEKDLADEKYAVTYEQLKEGAEKLFKDILPQLNQFAQQRFDMEQKKAEIEATVKSLQWESRLSGYINQRMAAHENLADRLMQLTAILVYRDSLQTRKEVCRKFQQQWDAVSHTLKQDKIHTSNFKNLINVCNFHASKVAESVGASLWTSTLQDVGSIAALVSMVYPPASHAAAACAAASNYTHRSDVGSANDVSRIINSYGQMSQTCQSWVVYLNQETHRLEMVQDQMCYWLAQNSFFMSPNEYLTYLNDNFGGLASKLSDLKDEVSKNNKKIAKLKSELGDIAIDDGGISAKKRQEEITKRKVEIKALEALNLGISNQIASTEESIQDRERQIKFMETNFHRAESWHQRKQAQIPEKVSDSHAYSQMRFREFQEIHHMRWNLQSRLGESSSRVLHQFAALSKHSEAAALGDLLQVSIEFYQNLQVLVNGMQNLRDDYHHIRKCIEGERLARDVQNVLYHSLHHEHGFSTVSLKEMISKVTSALKKKPGEVEEVVIKNLNPSFFSMLYGAIFDQMGVENVVAEIILPTLSLVSTGLAIVQIIDRMITGEQSPEIEMLKQIRKELHSLFATNFKVLNSITAKLDEVHTDVKFTQEQNKEVIQRLKTLTSDLREIETLVATKADELKQVIDDAHKFAVSESVSSRRDEKLSAPLSRMITLHRRGDPSFKTELATFVLTLGSRRTNGYDLAENDPRKVSLFDMVETFPGWLVRYFETTDGWKQALPDLLSKYQLKIFSGVPSFIGLRIVLKLLQEIKEADDDLKVSVANAEKLVALFIELLRQQVSPLLRICLADRQFARDESFRALQSKRKAAQELLSKVVKPSQITDQATLMTNFGSLLTQVKQCFSDRYELNASLFQNKEFVSNWSSQTVFHPSFDGKVDFYVREISHYLLIVPITLRATHSIYSSFVKPQFPIFKAHCWNIRMRQKDSGQASSAHDLSSLSSLPDCFTENFSAHDITLTVGLTNTRYPYYTTPEDVISGSGNRSFIHHLFVIDESSITLVDRFVSRNLVEKIDTQYLNSASLKLRVTMFDVNPTYSTKLTRAADKVQNVLFPRFVYFVRDKEVSEIRIDSAKSKVEQSCYACNHRNEMDVLYQNYLNKFSEGEAILSKGGNDRVPLVVPESFKTYVLEMIFSEFGVLREAESLGQVDVKLTYDLQKGAGKDAGDDFLLIQCEVTFADGIQGNLCTVVVKKFPGYLRSSFFRFDDNNRLSVDDSAFLIAQLAVGIGQKLKPHKVVSLKFVGGTEIYLPIEEKLCDGETNPGLYQEMETLRLGAMPLARSSDADTMIKKMTTLVKKCDEDILCLAISERVEQSTEIWKAVTRLLGILPQDAANVLLTSGSFNSYCGFQLQLKRFLSMLAEFRKSADIEQRHIAFAQRLFGLHFQQKPIPLHFDPKKWDSDLKLKPVTALNENPDQHLQCTLSINPLSDTFEYKECIRVYSNRIIQALLEEDLKKLGVSLVMNIASYTDCDAIVKEASKTSNKVVVIVQIVNGQHPVGVAVWAINKGKSLACFADSFGVGQYPLKKEKGWEVVMQKQPKALAQPICGAWVVEFVSHMGRDSVIFDQGKAPCQKAMDAFDPNLLEAKYQHFEKLDKGSKALLDSYSDQLSKTPPVVRQVSCRSKEPEIASQSADYNFLTTIIPDEVAESAELKTWTIDNRNTYWGDVDITFARDGVVIGGRMWKFVDSLGDGNCAMYSLLGTFCKTRGLYFDPPQGKSLRDEAADRLDRILKDQNIENLYCQALRLYEKFHRLAAADQKKIDLSGIDSESEKQALLPIRLQMVRTGLGGDSNLQELFSILDPILDQVKTNKTELMIRSTFRSMIDNYIVCCKDKTPPQGAVAGDRKNAILVLKGISSAILDSEHPDRDQTVRKQFLSAFKREETDSLRYPYFLTDDDIRLCAMLFDQPYISYFPDPKTGQMDTFQMWRNPSSKKRERLLFHIRGNHYITAHLV